MLRSSVPSGAPTSQPPCERDFPTDVNQRRRAAFGWLHVSMQPRNRTPPPNYRASVPDMDELLFIV